MNFAIWFRAELASVSQWIVQELDNLYTAIGAAWSKEHLDDGTHAAVHALSVTELGRNAAMGYWQDIPVDSGTFSGSESMTWTVDTADRQTLRYMVIGNTMTIAWYITLSTVAGTPSYALQIKIPTGYKAAHYQTGTYAYEEGGGTFAVGVCDVIPLIPATAFTGEYIRLFHNDYFTGTTWGASVNLTDVLGSFTFEVTTR